MAQWYYSEGGEQRGPVSRDVIKDLIGSGKLPESTLLWQEGMKDWKPASELPGFEPPAANEEASPYAPPQATADAGIEWRDHEPTGNQVRPWVRYWARTFDFLTFSILGGAVMGLVAPAVLEIPEQFIGLVFLVIYNFADALLLSTLGATPFRAILNVRVRNRDGSKLSFQQALQRSFSVWFAGQGMGIPIISFITNLYSYSRLSNRGITSWDESGGFVVSHQTIPWWRWMLLIGAFMTFVYFISLGLSEAGLNG